MKRRHSDKPSFMRRLIQKLSKIRTFSASIKTVLTSKAPEPVGPYSQAVSIYFYYRYLVVCSGQIPLDPETSRIVGSDIETQTKQVFQNVQAVLSAEKLTLSHVIKTSVFLTDLRSFDSFNEVYSSYFKDHKPARTLVEVSALPKGALVEMEVWAVR